VKLEKNIFKKGSTTYYWSSKFFPPAVRRDVFKLYSFVRVADDYVDEQPNRPKEFFVLKTAWQTGETNQLSNLNKKVLANIIELSEKYDFKREWIDSFLAAMESDLLPRPHKTLKESQTYVYGSAGVIGLMMARIMGLSKSADQYALLQGQAMQWINFIRDVNEDNALGRSYLPQNELKKFGLKNLSKQEATKKPEEFKAFMQMQILRYRDWQTAANKGFQFIPRRLLIPLKTAVDMYDWTAEQIERDPFIVFERKIKPSKMRVLCAVIRNNIRG